MSEEGRTPGWRRLRDRLDPDAADRRAIAEMEREVAEVRHLREARRGREAAEAAEARELEALERRRRTRGVRVTWTRMGEGMMNVWRELKVTVRSLARAPGFAMVAVLTLAIGIGANALIYGVVDGVVLRPLPYPQADRLVGVWSNGLASRGEYETILERAPSLEEVAIWQAGIGVNLEVDGEGVRIAGSDATPALFRMTGEDPALGRFPSEEATDVGGPREIAISWQLWRDRFGQDPAVLGRSVVLDGDDWTIVGVLSRDHDFPSATDDFVRAPVIDAGNAGPYWGFASFQILGRLAPGRTIAGLHDELVQLANASRLENPLWTPPEDYRAGSTTEPLREALVGNVRAPILFLLGAVALVLIVVTANVANLLLSRALSRRQDHAVRVAMGAGRGRMVASGVAEGLVLAVIGTGLGLVIAVVGLEILKSALPAGLPRAASIGLDGRVLAVTAAVASAVGILTGLIASARRIDEPASLLRSGARGGIGRDRRLLSRGLVFAQIALSVVLVTTAGLLLRSLGALATVDPGFDYEALVTSRVHANPFETQDEAVAFHRDLRERIARRPGITSVALAGSIPFGPINGAAATWIDGVTENPNALPFPDRYNVSSGYFETMGVDLLLGRDFGPQDVAGAEQVAIVDETFANEHYDGPADALGRIIRLYYPTADPIRIVGVVAAHRDDVLSARPQASYWVPITQVANAEVTVVARTTNPEAALASIAGSVREIDPRIPLSRQQPYSATLGATLAESRLLAILTTLFGVTTLLLGAIGLYGVATYMVREQTREFGVRLALGARPETIRAAVLRSGLRLAVPGAILGLVLAWPATRIVEGFLFGISALDPVTFVSVPLVLIATTILAVWLPARRATRLDPARVLREG